MEHDDTYRHELGVFDARGEENSEQVGIIARDSHELAPADGGLRAWLFLGACFSIEALTWGFPMSFGIFQDYYSTQARFSTQASSVPVIGTTQTGLMYFTAPLLSWGLQSFPHLRRPCCFVGLLILLLGLVTASFAGTVAHLIVTQGVIYGIGGGMLYFPVVTFLDEWFVRRRGLAYGIMWAGTGAAGIFLPYIMDWLLSTYGFQTTLRAWAIAMACLTVPALFFIKPRIPLQARRTQPPANEGTADRAAQQTPRRRPTDLGFLCTPAFWVLQAANVLVNLGYFMPTIFMPAYARSQGFKPNPRNIGTTAISLYNLATVLGAVATGFMLDRVSVVSVVLASSLGSAGAIFLLWGFAVAPPVLYVFALAYGLLGGGFSVTWSGCAAAIRAQMEKRGGQGAGANVQTAMVISTFAAGKGIGAVVSGPLSSRLFELVPGVDGGLGAYGTRYEAIVIFTGVSTCFGGLGWLGRRLGAV